MDVGIQHRASENFFSESGAKAVALLNKLLDLPLPQRYLPEHATDLVGIASRWAQFQQLASIMIMAAGLAQENLLVRDATHPGWKRGLEATTGVICDVVTARDLPKGCFPLVFRLLSEASFAELRAMETTLSERVPPPLSTRTVTLLKLSSSRPRISFCPHTIARYRSPP